jgi:diacylglycerol kinase/CheY-like chemotaxis protein
VAALLPALPALHGQGGQSGSTMVMGAGDDLCSMRPTLAGFAEATRSPFPLGEVPAGEAAAGRPPAPVEVVEAASLLAQLLEAGEADPATALRRSAQLQSSLHPAAVEAAIACASSALPGSGARILLADGDAPARSLLALRLENEGYLVSSVGDGRAALDEIRSERPDLVLSESVLPGLDGFALLDALKREGLADVPVLILSSRADAASVNKGLLMGAADYLGKPVNLEVLLTKMERVLSQDVAMATARARLSLADLGTGSLADLASPTVRYSDLKPGLRILNRFEIQDELGEGGMGKVFKAIDHRLEETIVIKVLKDALISDASRVSSFKREIRIARRIAHPGIVRSYDFFEAGPLHFVTMEYLEGRNLRQELKRRGPFPAARALRVALEVLEALEAAHALGVVHRDIKPHNVLLLATGHVKVLDFGIAQALEPDSQDGGTRSIVGTPEYMSPEQAEMSGVDIDTRSDIYSLGVLLYELLTGSLPFDAQRLRSAAFNEVQRIILPVLNGAADRIDNVDFFAHEHNAWIHMAATITVIISACWFHVSRQELVILIIVIGFVWVSEIFNTAIEKMMDFIAPGYHPRVKLIKDLAAAGVLVASITALATGAFIFIPKIF